MNESSGLKAQMALAPASARYKRKQTMWGGTVSSRNRDRLRTARMTEIRAMAGQKILFSGRLSMMLFTVLTAGDVTKISSGETIKANTHAEIGTTVHASMTEAGGFRPRSRERIGGFDIMALYSMSGGAVTAMLIIAEC